MVGLFSSFSQRVLLSSCGAQASHCGGISLRSTGSRVSELQCLWHMGSVAVAFVLWTTGLIVWAHQPGCSTACNIFLDQGSDLCLLHQQVNCLPGSPILHLKKKLGYLSKVTQLAGKSSHIPAKFLKEMEIVISIQKMLFQDIPQISSLHCIFLLFLETIQIFLLKIFSIWTSKTSKGINVISPTYINVY